MPKQYYSLDEYSIDDSDDDRYSYVSEKSEKTYSSPCRCRKCNKPKKCKPVKECYTCGNQDKYQKNLVNVIILKINALLLKIDESSGSSLVQPLTCHLIIKKIGF